MLIQCTKNTIKPFINYFNKIINNARLIHESTVILLIKDSKSPSKLAGAKE